jgi:flagellar protein FlgJ
MSAGLPGVAVDTRPLDQLKLSAKTAPDKALAAAARQFEAIFMQMLLKSMRDSVSESGLFQGSGDKMYTEMFDTQLAQNLSARGLGIADMLVKQLSPSVKAQASVSGASPDAAAPKAPAPDAAAGPPPLSEADGMNSVVASARAPAGAQAAQAFVDQMLPDAQAAESATGVPAEYILGQAALESGWGRRQITGTDGTPSYNLFGVKAGSGWKGATVDAVTTEYVGGRAFKTMQKFRAYGSYAEAFRDYSQLMAASPRYAPALQGARSPVGLAGALQSAGYATDPAYAEKLTRVINQTLALARAE